MKKLFSTIGLLTLAASMFAVTYTAKANISLTSANQSAKTLKVREAATFSDAFDNGYDSENVSAGGIYVYYASKNWGIWATNALDGAIIGFGTIADATYTMSFDGVDGRVLKIEDLVADSIITITEGGSYVFTADPNQTAINDRFRFFKPFTPDAGALNICHQYKKLTINNNPYTTNIVVKNSSDVVVVDKAPRTTPQVIDISTLPAGRYTVEIGTETLIIDVQ